MLFDEIDWISYARGGKSDVREYDRIVNTLLCMMDRPRQGLIRAATSIPDAIDAALLRRFELRIEFQRPTVELIEQLVRQTLAGHCSHLDTVALSRGFDEVSPARIVENCRQAIKRSVLENRPIEPDDFFTLAGSQARNLLLSEVLKVSG